MEYRADQAEQGWLNVLKNNTWFELNFLNNVESAVYYQHRELWNSFKSYIRGLHLTNFKSFLINYADYEQKEEVNRIAYDWHREMIQHYQPYMFTFVTAVACDDPKKYRYDLEPPLVVFHLCNQASNATRLNWTRGKGGKVFHVRPTDREECNLDNVILPKTTSERETFIRDKCAPECLMRVGLANPFVTHFYYWIDIATIESPYISEIVHQLTVVSKEQNYNLGTFLAITVDESHLTRGVMGMSTCDRIRVFGGSRFAVEKFCHHHIRSRECQGPGPLIAKRIILGNKSLKEQKLKKIDVLLSHIKDANFRFCEEKTVC